MIPTLDPLLELLLLLLLDAPEDVDDALGLTGTPRELTVSDADRLKGGRRRLLSQRNTIIVPLTSCLTGLDLSVLQIKGETTVAFTREY